MKSGDEIDRCLAKLDNNEHRITRRAAMRVLGMGGEIGRQRIMVYRIRFLTLLAFGAVLIALGIVSSGGVVDAASSARTDVIIGFQGQPGPAEQALVQRAGGTIKYAYHLVPAIAASVPEAAIAGLQANPNVTSIDLDIEIHAVDAELDNTWGVKRVGAGLVHDGGNKGAGVKVGVLDTGIDTDHPDLSYDPTCSASFVNGESLEDGNGHGTHTAGTVAALDNNVGTSVVGMAPEVTLCIYKVLSNSGSGSYSDVIAALQQAVADGVQVTNNSYGTSGDPGPTVKAAFDNAYAAGVLHAAAAGNSGNPPGRGDNCIFPALWESLIATAATKQDDSRASFSSTCEELELSAPGYRVNSTWNNGGYREASGTSMASPHVAGVAALVIAAGITDANGDGNINDEVRQVLADTADDLGATGRDSQYGFGLVDADEAATPSAPDATAPVISNPEPTNISDTSAEITWTTDEPADSWVDYGLDATYGSSVSDGSLVMGHSINLTGLDPSTEYHYEVTSADAASNSASSADFTFTTAAPPPPDLTAPVISGVTDTDITDTSATITWTTDEPSDSRVDSGLDATYGSVVSDASLVTSHSINLTGLAPSTEYHYKVTSADAALNSASSADFTFTTAAASAEATSFIVSSVTYTTDGGKNKDKHLLITVTLVDNLGGLVSGASVSIDLFRDGPLIASGTGTTGAEGTVTFSLKNAASGCYTETGIVAAGGLTWDNSWPDSVPTDPFCK